MLREALAGQCQIANEDLCGSATRQSDRHPHQRPVFTTSLKPQQPPPERAKHSAEASSATTRSGKIFLWYRRDDVDIAGRIFDRLSAKFGKENIFKDVDSIPLGVDFRKHLATMVENCDVLIAVIGSHWIRATQHGKSRLDDAKDFVRIELDAALKRDIPLVPVLIRGATMPDETDLPERLGTVSYRQGMSVRADPDFHRDLDNLIEGLQVPLGKLILRSSLARSFRPLIDRQLLLLHRR